MYRQGQRLLLALASPADGGGEENSEQFSVAGILAAVGSVVCVILILLLCACRKSDRKDEIEDVELQQSTKKGNRKSQAHTPQESGDAKSKVDIETVGVNGGAGQTSNTFPGHSRQASSGSAHMRPTSLRELPEPPVSSNHHSRNKSLSGIDLPSTSTKSGAGGGGGGGAAAEGGSEYPYPQLVHHPRNSKNNAAAGANGKEKVKSHSDGYDHLGPKQTMKPTDYDQLGEPENADVETPLSEISGGLDGHYSMLRERTYAVVVDVKAKAKGLFDPYSKVKDKDDSGSDYYSQVKEEDPYNHISDGNVSTSFIRRLRQSHDFDDTYSTVQDDSGGDLKSVLESIGTARATSSHISPSASSQISNSPSNQQDDEDVEDEYAVVQKAKGLPEHPAEKDGRSHSDHDMSPYNIGPPPEPPRLYKDYDNVEISAASKHKREHKYSKVTARESLASMSARNALNPYEIVADLPENTYATVEGGSGDGVIIRGGAAGGDMEKRLSQTSDTYAEIGISGEGLSSSMISSNNSSSVGGNNSSSISNIAPVPPSLDSLHLMTKSQTSSEGDRLSDRHLASPEDSGMSLNIWGDIPDGEDSEDGYSTLKKPDPGLQSLSLPAIPGSSFVTDEDSGEVTLVPNYQTVKDCISDNETMEEAESDPNYESVDEARAKVALLKARNSSLVDSRMSPFNSKSGASNHVTVVKVLNMNSAAGGVDLAESKEELQKSRPRRRRLDHDYEEVDLSPPPSPITPLSSNHTNTSSYQTTSVSTNIASLSSQAESGSDLFDARERAIQSHMYEELSVVRAKTSEMSKAKKANSLAKSGSEDKKTSSNDKKKAEEKHKSGSEDKRKHEPEDKRKNVSDDRKKNVNDDKRKTGADDKKKGGSAVHNGTRI